MNEIITVVTPPDDFLEDGPRILLVGLEPHQTNLVSEALRRIDNQNFIVYMFDETSNAVEWMVDKKHKSSIILFNADMQDQTVAGYVSAQRNSYYFGTLKSIGIINKNAIYSIEQLIQIMEERCDT
jgi:hypothetical protein